MLSDNKGVSISQTKREKDSRFQFAVHYNFNCCGEWGRPFINIVVRYRYGIKAIIIIIIALFYNTKYILYQVARGGNKIIQKKEEEDNNKKEIEKK
jgi:hypothetical protein